MEFKKENLKFVPEKPGVYLFYDKKKRLLYVGKARNLREDINTPCVKKSIETECSKSYFY